MMTQDEGHNKDFVQALANGLDVLAAFGPKPRELTIAQLAEITGQSRASTRRAVVTLECLDYLKRNGPGRVKTVQLSPEAPPSRPVPVGPSCSSIFLPIRVWSQASLNVGSP